MEGGSCPFTARHSQFCTKSFCSLSGPQNKLLSMLRKEISVLAWNQIRSSEFITYYSCWM